MSHDNKLIFVVGPTAVGKTPVALDLADLIGGEIVMCDSMQVYKELTILSNKPNAQQLTRVPHHLINLISVAEAFNVNEYFKLAQKVIEDIHARGKVPIVSGGTGMYMQVLMDGIFQENIEDKLIRQQLYLRCENGELLTLHRELKEVDPIAAGKIHPNDMRRTVRALAVYQTTGKPLSEHQNERQGLWSEFESYAFELKMDRTDLYDRINHRTLDMFERGAVDEVRNVPEDKWSLPARSMIGVKEILSHLRDERDLQNTVSLIQRNTRRYAKRQLTWFRHESRLRPVDIDVSCSRKTAEKIMDIL